MKTLKFLLLKSSLLIIMVIQVSCGTKEQDNASDQNTLESENVMSDSLQKAIEKERQKQREINYIKRHKELSSIYHDWNKNVNKITSSGLHLNYRGQTMDKGDNNMFEDAELFGKISWQYDSYNHLRAIAFEVREYHVETAGEWATETEIYPLNGLILYDTAKKIIYESYNGLVSSADDSVYLIKEGLSINKSEVQARIPNIDSAIQDNFDNLIFEPSIEQTYHGRSRICSDYGINILRKNLHVITKVRESYPKFFIENFNGKTNMDWAKSDGQTIDFDPHECIFYMGRVRAEQFYEIFERHGFTFRNWNDTIVHEDLEYPTIAIGKQKWLAYDIGSNFPANPIGKRFSTSELESACPEGWHIPDSSEWHQLFQKTRAYDSLENILSGLPYFWTEVKNKRNKSGFSAIPNEVNGSNADYISGNNQTGEYLKVKINKDSIYFENMTEIDAARCRCVED